MLHESGQSLKEKGNEHFKSGKFENAIEMYTAALDVSLGDRDLFNAVLSNRAACYLKVNKYQECIDDCSAALEINGSQPKPYYRRALAHEKLGDLQAAYKDLSRLIHIDSKNVDGIKAIRRVKASLEKIQSQDSEVNRILSTISSGKKVEEGIRALIGLCVDDASHSMDLVRKGGLAVVGQIIDSDLRRADSVRDFPLAVLGLRLFGAASSHTRFVSGAISLGSNCDDVSVIDASAPLSLIVNEGDGAESARISWQTICELIAHENGHIAQAASSLAMRCLKAWPAGVLLPPTPTAPPAEACAADDNTPRVEELDDEDDGNASKTDANKAPPAPPPPMKEYDLFIKKTSAVLALRGWLRALAHEDLEAFSLTTDSLSAFFSETEEYIGHDKIVDARMEGLQERKDRMAKVRLLKKRSIAHAQWAVEEGAIELLLRQMDAGGNGLSGDLSARRQRASACFGRLVSALDNDEVVKARLEPFLVGRDRPVLQPGDPLPPMDKCRMRAVMEAALFLSRPDVGAWALREGGGIPQLLLLTSSGDDRCQEVAAEVMCLAATSESGSSQLSVIVSSGALQTLMRSPVPTTRAAAASALTKLSLQAKALKEDSSETSEMLNVVLEVLKGAAAADQCAAAGKKDSAGAKGGKDSTTHLVSFSAVGDAFGRRHHDAPGEVKDGQKSSRALTSTERAVEVLAALVGKTFVKEELVHGSYRVAASLEALLRIDLDPASTARSTAPYGVAHILAALTVTNKELRAKALAEKDISVEQYEQLQELQRVKAKDNEGNDIEEKKEEDDPDTETLCRNRIKRIAAANGITAIIKLMSHESKQTKEYASRALRQMCVEESIRGQVVQQGGLKACIALAADEDCEKSARREAAHAIAKTLVTTNPHILSEHLRLGVMHPLIFLCREVDSTNLQQFEALLTLTNLTSCGPAEQDRFVADKGISAVHYLMFSDHLMVRRAAAEVLCNMGGHESLLKLLRVPDKVRLWLGFAEDWDNEENEEAFATARAAAGTLAYAASDEDVAKALLTENCTTSVLSLLESENVELAHRAMVIISELCNQDADLAADLATHLVEGGVVPSLAVMMQLRGNEHDSMIADLARNAASALSKAISNKTKSDDGTGASKSV